MTTTSKPKSPPVERKIAERWGTPLTKAGWTALPTVILKRQKALNLSPLDLTIIMQLASFWWEAPDLPRPSKKLLAERIGVEPRTIQKRIASMEAGGLIKRVSQLSAVKGNNPNLYDFSGLIEQAAAFAVEELEEIEKRKIEHAAKMARKRPKLSAVK